MYGSWTLLRGAHKLLVVERPFLCVGVPKDLELEKERR